MIKGTAEFTLTAIGGGRLGRRIRGGRVVVLAYHNVVPDELGGSGDSSLHLPLSTFRRHLDLICRDFQPLALQDLLESHGPATTGETAVVITFDDAYRGTLDLALPELTRRGLTATVFVAPSLLGDRTLWWDAMAESWAREPEPNLRSRILEEGRGRLEEAAQIGRRHGVHWQEMSELLRTSTESELHDAIQRNECTVGSHTWSHASLVALDEEGVEEELARSRSWLQERFGTAYLDVLSYPYGNCSSTVETLVERCGYRAGMALTKRSLRAGEVSGRFRIPRMNVPAGISDNGMQLRMSWR